MKEITEIRLVIAVLVIIAVFQAQAENKARQALSQPSIAHSGRMVFVKGKDADPPAFPSVSAPSKVILAGAAH